MSDDIKPALPKLRTYAQDLKRAQHASGEPMPTDVKMPVAQPKVGTDTPLQAEIKKEISAAASATSIPAFHELQKKKVGATPAAPAIQKGPSITAPPVPKAPAVAKKVTVRAKKQETKPEPKIVSGGTIITDTRKGDFDFVSSFFTSIDKWFASLASSFKKKKAPTYSITATDRRKGVIQKATTKTGTIFTADNETLKEEIRRRQAGIGRTDANDGKTEILWSPNTEAGYALLPGEQMVVTPKVVTEKHVTVEFKKRTPPPAPVFVEPSVPQPIEAVLPAPAVVYTPPTPPPPPIAVPTPPEPTEPELTTEPVSFEDEPIEEEMSEQSVPEENLPEPTKTDWRSIRSLRDLSSLRTNTIAIGIVVFLLCLTIFVIGVRLAMQLFAPTEEVVLSVPASPALIEGATVTTVVVSPLTVTEVITALRTEATTDTTIHEIRIIDDTGRVISAPSILTLLSTSVNPNFSQSVTDLHLVTIGTKRALVFRVTDATTAFGALLEWEPSMATDLGTILGMSDTPDSFETFTDQTYRGIDLRILTTNDIPLITYGFIDETTIVITTDSAVFDTLLGE